MGESNEKSSNEGEKKKDDGNVPVVLKTDIHCDGCAKKVVRSIKRLEGVESVQADTCSNKVIVVAKIDPLKLRDRVESKTKKKVELISPIPTKDKHIIIQTVKKPEEKKEPQVTTVTFKTILHCQGCTQKIHKSAHKFKGVEMVSINKLQDTVTVKGTMDVNELSSYLKKKSKTSVDIIPPKKDDQKGKTSGGGKKEKGSGGGGGDQNKKEEAKPQEDHSVKPAELLTNKLNYYGPEYGYGYNVHPPQLFSDENPNACLIM